MSGHTHAATATAGELAPARLAPQADLAVQVVPPAAAF